MVSIGIMGDLSTDTSTQTTIEPALQHAAAKVGVNLEAEWIGTEAINAGPEDALSRFDGLFAAAGTPKSVSGALCGIEYARTQNRVFVGTCGGFQHAVLEYARNVCGLTRGAHQEYDPQSAEMVLTALPCSIVGRVMRVQIERETLAAKIFGVSEIREEYYCNFGINPEYERPLTAGGLVISARDEDRAPRIVELPDPRFFIASLFVPQTSSCRDQPHPLLVAFVAADRSRRIRNIPSRRRVTRITVN